ncbi:MAG TPA: NAD-dependent epimerase/dehydratase family protein, partial [Kofleriaceae bacterium]|nr:NAD-dependent epimerase/dehydratase family protein [Kofleriaceae bacterium]
MTVLVLGATGFVGRQLVTALSEVGETVRAASRTAPRRSADSEQLASRWIYCDLAQPETIPPALEDVDAAYYLVHSMGRH